MSIFEADDRVSSLPDGEQRSYLVSFAEIFSFSSYVQSQKFDLSLRLSGRHVTGSFESSFRFLREEDADVLRIRRGSLSSEPENKEVHSLLFQTSPCSYSLKLSALDAKMCQLYSVHRNPSVWSVGGVLGRGVIKDGCMWDIN